MGKKNSLLLLPPLIFLVAVPLSTEEPVYYVSTEHVNVTYCNPEYGYLNATASRPGRWDPKYYLHVYMRTLKTLDNNVKVDVWFYEFLSNEYKRGFVEMHFHYCDLILKDNFFGPALRANLPGCPVPPGEYRMSNMSIPDLPLLRTFPFRKGRIYTLWSDAKDRILAVYSDFEIKIKPKVRHTKSKSNNVTSLTN